MLYKTILTNQLWDTGYYPIPGEHVKNPQDKLDFTLCYLLYLWSYDLISYVNVYYI